MRSLTGVSKKSEGVRVQVALKTGEGLIHLIVAAFPVLFIVAELLHILTLALFIGRHHGHRRPLPGGTAGLPR